MTRGPQPAPVASRHQRARELAAARADGFLTRDETTWLDRHLAACDECRGVAGEYAAQRSLFDGARGDYPTPPRDLWARTAAAIEATGSRRRRPAARRRPWFGAWTLAPVAAVMVVAIVVGAGLLRGLPSVGPSASQLGPAATPIALDAADVRMVTRGADGSLQIRRQRVDQVCPVGANGCDVLLTPELTQTEPLFAGTTLDAIISPTQDQVVVAGNGEGGPGVYVVQVAATAPTPGPSATATPSAPATPVATRSQPVATPTATPTATLPTIAPSASPSVTPSLPSTSPSPSVGASPTSSAPGSPSTSAPASMPPSSASPSASASGAVTASGSPSPTISPSASGPVETGSPTVAPPSPSATIAVTPRPDGAVEIARGVTIVGSTAAYSPDGTRFAFSATAADAATGPDVYLWTVGTPRAEAVTSDHASLFSGWLGGDLLISRANDGRPTTVLRSVATDVEQVASSRPMWRPTVNAGTHRAVWWDGTVKRDGDGLQWVPDHGSLVLDTWPAADGEGQVLAGDGLVDWQVDWDETGTLLAVWTNTAGPGKPGAISLYAIDRSTGRADLDHPKLAGAPAYEGFSMSAGRLTWSAPGLDGQPSVQILAWKGDTFGRMELETQGGTTVVR